MSADDYVILEWSYTPENFFEEPIYVRRDDCEIRIEGGKATATIDPDCYDAEHRKRDELHEVVKAYFRAVQVVTHKGYDLSKAGMAREHPDGRRDVTIFPESVTMTMTVGNVDLIVKDAEGSVVRDTRRERIDAELALGEAVARLAPSHPVLRKMLDSYGEAVGDPDKELVRLYEIWDALKSRFGARQAEAVLKLEKGRGGRLEKLANDRTVRQGRHSGQHLGESRDATAEELREVREISRHMIEAYVRWADRSPDK